MSVSVQVEMGDGSVPETGRVSVHRQGHGRRHGHRLHGQANSHDAAAATATVTDRQSSSSQGSHRFTPYPFSLDRDRPSVRTPGFIEELEKDNSDEERKFFMPSPDPHDYHQEQQQQYDPPPPPPHHHHYQYHQQQQQHPHHGHQHQHALQQHPGQQAPPLIGGYQTGLEQQRPSESASAGYAHGSSSHPYMTNSGHAAVCQPLTYDGSAVNAIPQAVPGEAFQPTPLGYPQQQHQQHHPHPHHHRDRHQEDTKDLCLTHSVHDQDQDQDYDHNHDHGHGSMVVQQYHQHHQDLAVGSVSGGGGFSASHCVNPSSIINIAREPGLNFSVQEVLIPSTQHIDPSLEELSPSPSSQQTYIKASSYTSFASSPAADQIVVAGPSNHHHIPMDITLLDNPLPEDGQDDWANPSAASAPTAAPAPAATLAAPDQPIAMVIDDSEDGRNSSPDDDYTIITREEFSSSSSSSSSASPTGTISRAAAGAASSSTSNANNRGKNKKKKKGVRGPFTNLTKRAETAETRRRRACTRCREQKQRCETDPENPNGECQGCKAWNKLSKKTIHRAPCQRGKITDARLVRQGGLNLTQRWKGTELHNVVDRVQPLDIRESLMTLGTCDEPLRLKLVRFIPITGDVTSRYWTDRGRRKEAPLAAFCLHNIFDTANEFEKYAWRNSVPTLRKYCQYNTPARPPWYRLIERTYGAALNYYETLRMDGEMSSDPVLRQHLPQKVRLFEHLFLLCFTSRHTTGSLYICGGDTLGMKPPSDKSYPLAGKISAPRMVVAQFDSILTERFLVSVSKMVLRGLEDLIQQKSESSWWAIYLVVWILCRETALLTADRYRHARSNYGSRLRYSLPAFVEELHSSITIIVQHWHYYNTMPWPDPVNPFERHRSCTANLTSTDHEVVLMGLLEPCIVSQLRYRKILRANNYTIPADASGHQAMDWDHPLFWVAQMYEPDWTPHQTYQREVLTAS